MKFVVTGAGGFVGHAVASDLVQSRAQVIACMRPNATQHPLGPDPFGPEKCFYGSLEGPSFSKMIAQEQPDWLIHCAGSASVGASISDPKRDYVDNVELTRQVYSCLATHSPRTRVLFMSSAAVYGQPVRLPIDETTPCNPISPYGKHKLSCEELGDWFQNHRDLRVTNLRIFSAYGPRLTKQVLWDTYQKSMRSDCVELAGDGNETRDFVYIRDVANLVRFIVNELDWNQRVINVASGRSVSIRRLAEQFLSELGFQGQLRFNGTISAGSPRFWSADNSQIVRLNLEPFTTLEEGMREYVRWIKTAKGDSHSNRILARSG